MQSKLWGMRKVGCAIYRSSKILPIMRHYAGLAYYAEIYASIMWTGLEATLTLFLSFDQAPPRLYEGGTNASDIKWRPIIVTLIALATMNRKDFIFLSFAALVGVCGLFAFVSRNFSVNYEVPDEVLSNPSRERDAVDLPVL